MLLKLKIKGLVLYLLYTVILLTLAFFLNKFFQMLIFVLFFEFLQSCFKYRFHADSIISDPIKSIRYCKLITITIEIFYLAFCRPLDVSVYSNLAIVLSIALVSCLLEILIEQALVKESYLKDKEKLIELCNARHLTKDACNRLIMRYIENKSYQEIADIECVDVNTIKKSLNRSRHKLFNG